MGIGIDIKVNGGQLRAAKDDAASLRKNLRDISNEPIKIKVQEPSKGIDESSFPQHTVSSSEVARQNQILSRSINDLIRETRKPSWRDHYEITKQPVNRPPSNPDGESFSDGGGRGGFIRNSLRWGGRVAGYGAALAGGFSLLSLLHNSVNQASSYGSGEADLLMRGGTGRFRRTAALLGYTPEESLAIQGIIGHKTGFTGESLDDVSHASARYARLMGVSGEAVAGYIGGSYGATGASVREYDKQLKYLRDSAVALGARGRIEEVLRGNQEIMTNMVRGRGGAELSDRDRYGMLAMQMGLWGTPGQIGKGSSGVNLLSAVDQGIRNGGSSPGQKIFLAQALGVEGVNGLKDIWEFNKRMNEGGSARNVKAVLDYSESIAKQRGMSPDDARMFAMMNVRDSLGLNERQTEAMFERGFRDTLNTTVSKGGEIALERFSESAAGRKNLRHANVDPMSLKGNSHRQTLAQFANTEVDVGEKALPLVDNLKRGTIRMVSSLEKGDYLGAMTGFVKDNPLGQLMLASTGLNLASKLPLGFAGGMATGSVAGAVAGGALRKALTKMIGGSLYKWAPGIGWVMAALPIWDENAGDARTDDVMRRINQGTSPEVARREVYGSQQNGGADLGGLTEAIWALVNSLSSWAHNVNNDPLPQRFRERN